MPKINFAKVKGLEPIPAGRYTVTVTSAEEKQSKAGNPKIDLKLKVEGGPQDGRTLFESLTFTEQTLWRVKNALLALGFKKDFDGDVRPEELVGKSCEVGVTIAASEGTNPDTGEPYAARNRIDRWYAIGSGGDKKRRPLA